MDKLRSALMVSAVFFSPAEVHDLRSDTEWGDALDRAMSAALENPLPLEVFKVAEQVCVCRMKDDIRLQFLFRITVH